MDYFLNEYSLRGQFKSVEDFLDSCRMYTMPVINKIEKNSENIIWKKDTFWQCHVCEGIPLYNIPKKKNESSGELAWLKLKLIKLYSTAPFWETEEDVEMKIKEYNFDEEYRELFEDNNCFCKAVKSEGRIISFMHPAYDSDKLSIVLDYNTAESECFLDNIYMISWWENEPIVKTWRVCHKYLIEVRSNEFDFHPPHFHVSCNEFALVFKLKDGELYASSKRKMSSQMISEIKEWYRAHKSELEDAWKRLHSHPFFTGNILATENQ